MSTDDKVPFLILITREGNAPYTAQCYVRAKSLAEAYAQVLQDEHGLAQHPDIRLQGFVVSAGMLATVLPLKELAAFYWNLGKTQEFPTFDEAWDEHGESPDVEE